MPRGFTPILSAHHPAAADRSTIGDRLSEKQVAWAWYAGAWNAALGVAARRPTPNGASSMPPIPRRVIPISSASPSRSTIRGLSIRPSHAAERAAHLKDYDQMVADIAAGRLPP